MLFTGLSLLCASCAQRSATVVSGPALSIHHYFTEPPRQQIFELSPDGRRLAALEEQGDAINITVVDLQTGDKFQATDFVDSRVSAYTWANNERLLFYTDNELEVLAVNFDGNMKRRLTRPGIYTQAIHRLPSQADVILVAQPGRNSMLPDVYAINIFSGRATTVQKGPRGGFPEQWFTDMQGVVLGSVINNGKTMTIMHFNHEESSWTETIKEPGQSAAIQPLRAPLDGQWGIAASRPVSGTTGVAPQSIYRFDFSTGKLGETLLVMDGMKCCDLLVAPRTGNLISATSTGKQDLTLYFDQDYQQAAAQISSALNGRDIRFISLDDEESRGVVIATSPLYEPDFYLFDLENKELTLLADSSQVVDTLAQHRERLRDIMFAPQQARFTFDMERTPLPTANANWQVDRTLVRSVNAGSGNN